MSLLRRFQADASSIYGLCAALAQGQIPWPVEAELHALRREVGRLVGLDASVHLAHLDAALVADESTAWLGALQRLGVIAVLLPEVSALIGFHASSPIHHKDLWDHTLQVIARIPPDADLRWAALMHDAGKIATRHIPSEDPTTGGGVGTVAFLRHESVGAWLVAGVAARLGMSAERSERIAFVVEHHGRINAYEKGWTDRAVRRLMRDAGPRLPDLLAFSQADFTTKRTAKARRIRESLRHLGDRIERLRREDACDLPRGLGLAVAAACGLLAGPEIGVKMAWIKAQVMAGSLPSGAPAEVYVAAVRARADGGADAVADDCLETVVAGDSAS